MTASLLDVAELSVTFGMPDGPIEAVRSLSYELRAGETLGIVGESGSGKSQSVLALMGLLADNGRAAGRAIFEGRQILGLPEAELTYACSPSRRKSQSPTRPGRSSDL